MGLVTAASVALAAGGAKLAGQAKRVITKKIGKALAPPTDAAPAEELKPEMAKQVTETTPFAGESPEEAERRRRRGLLSGIRTGPLGIRPGEQTTGRARLLG